MTDIQAGDVVVCVDDTDCGCGCNSKSPLQLRAMYRVETIGPDWLGFIGVTLKGVTPPGSHMGFDVVFFRKIKPATDEFISQIKAIRPIREDA